MIVTVEDPNDLCHATCDECGRPSCGVEDVTSALPTHEGSSFTVYCNGCSLLNCPICAAIGHHPFTCPNCGARYHPDEE